MESNKPLIIGRNSIKLLANSTKTKDYYFKAQSMFVKIDGYEKIPFTLYLKNAQGFTTGLPIYGEKEILNVSQYFYFCFEYNQIVEDIEIIINLK